MLERITRRSLAVLAGGAVVLLLAVGACADDPAGVDDVSVHADPLLSANASPLVKKKIAELRRWSARFHDVDKAAEAGYTAHIGCIDETIEGLDPSEARGMGYHVTRGDMDIVADGVIDIDQPEFLVYAPHRRDAELPREKRLGAARLVGFDYFVPGALWTDPDPPEFFGEPFDWSDTFQGWVRHIYLWGHNSDGIFENYNPNVGLCTELLTP